MSERRMFAKTIIDSDAFLDMPLSSQALYFHLSMRADDEGFINNPKKIQRMIGASDDDLKILIAKNFIIPFESGVVVIKHWRIHNWIRADRLVKTAYTEERAMLQIKDNGSYTTNVRQLTDICQTDVSIGKDSIGKDSIEENKEIHNVEPKKEPYIDQVKEVIDYLNLKTGKKYSTRGKANVDHIKARLREGFTVEECKKVIDNKCATWLNDGKMNQFLRPETLFSGKFEGYLNEVPNMKSNTVKNQSLAFAQRQYTEDEITALERRKLGLA